MFQLYLWEKDDILVNRVNKIKMVNVGIVTHCYNTHLSKAHILKPLGEGQSNSIQPGGSTNWMHNGMWAYLRTDNAGYCLASQTISIVIRSHLWDQLYITFILIIQMDFDIKGFIRRKDDVPQMLSFAERQHTDQLMAFCAGLPAPFWTETTRATCERMA